MTHRLICMLGPGLVLAGMLMIPGQLLAQESATSARQKTSPVQTYRVRGRVVWLHEVLKRRYGIKTVPEANQRILALETQDGTLFPIIEDVRGRAFRKDARLRKLDCELLVLRPTASSLIQVIRVYAHEAGQKVEVDYWCEICAIAMYELKPCDCCQGDIELRRRAVIDSRTQSP